MVSVAETSGELVAQCVLRLVQYRMKTGHGKGALEVRAFDLLRPESPLPLLTAGG